MAAITVSGDQALERKLTDTGRRVRHQQDVLAVQGRAAARAITGVPVATGTLAKSVARAQVKVGPWGFALLTGVDYARFVFRGTSVMEARPPHVPASVGANTAQALAADLRRIQ